MASRRRKEVAALSDVAERAYAIWEREGRPGGRALEHWLQAEIELAEPPAAARSARKATRAKKAAPKQAAPKKVAAKPGRTRRPRGKSAPSTDPRA